MAQKSAGGAAAPNKNTNFKVKNINGTGKNPYKNSSSKDGPSWLGIWKREAKSDRKTCAVIPCGETATVGAHVLVTDKRCSNEWYLAPFCKKHNNWNNTGEMFLDSRITLVSVRDDM